MGKAGMTDHLISDDYRAQNEALHASRPDFGLTGERWAETIEDLVVDHECASVLDYGCGKGSLARALGADDTLIVTEYDPAVPEKSTPPLPADLVACTDVLEHVEPDRVAAVIDDLRRLTKKVLFVSICTVPAKKTLADGRNAHLSVHTAQWWQDALLRRFKIDREWDVTFTHLTAALIPRSISEIASFNTVSALTEDQRNVYMRANIRRIDGARHIQEAPAHGRTAIVAAYGPSLVDSVDLLRQQRDAGGDVFSVSGAHAFLLKNDVPPLAHIDCDPRPHKAEQFATLGGPDPRVEYWLASCVHPAYLDAVEGCSTSLWHLWNSEQTMDAVPPGHWVVVGGSSVGLRALSLLYCLGYRHFALHGFDCSFRGTETHAGEHMGRKQETIDVRAGDRWFTTSRAMASYAREFFELKRNLLVDAQFAVCGDGLMQHMCKLSQEQRPA